MGFKRKWIILSAQKNPRFCLRSATMQGTHASVSLLMGDDESALAVFDGRLCVVFQLLIDDTWELDGTDLSPFRSAAALACTSICICWSPLPSCQDERRHVLGHTPIWVAGSKWDLGLVTAPAVPT